MSEVIKEVAELSRMKRDLSSRALELLRQPSEKFVDRLEAVAETTFMNNRHVGGTAIAGPSVLAYNRRGRVRKVNVRDYQPNFSMYVRNIPTDEGELTIFPLHTVGLTEGGAPIIDPAVKGSYSVLHLPDSSDSDPHNPHGMKADLAFTVDTDNLVTVNGQNRVTVTEYVLFDSIAAEFERLAGL